MHATLAFQTIRYTRDVVSPYCLAQSVASEDRYGAPPGLVWVCSPCGGTVSPWCDPQVNVRETKGTAGEGERERQRDGEAGMDGMAWIEGRGKTAVFSCVWLTVRLHCVPPPQSPYIQTLLQTCGCWLLGYSVSFGKIVWNASAWIREKIAFLSKKRANFHCEPCDPTKTSWVKMSFLVH